MQLKKCIATILTCLILKSTGNNNNYTCLPLQDPSVQSRESSADILMSWMCQSLLLCTAHEAGPPFLDDSV